jgi:hypothetical protein
MTCAPGNRPAVSPRGAEGVLLLLVILLPCLSTVLPFCPKVPSLGSEATPSHIPGRDDWYVDQYSVPTLPNVMKSVPWASQRIVWPACLLRDGVLLALKSCTPSPNPIAPSPNQSDDLKMSDLHLIY